MQRYITPVLFLFFFTVIQAKSFVPMYNYRSATDNTLAS